MKREVKKQLVVTLTQNEVRNILKDVKKGDLMECNKDTQWLIKYLVEFTE